MHIESILVGDQLNVALTLYFVSDKKKENIIEKGENAGHQHFHLCL